MGEGGRFCLLTPKCMLGRRGGGGRCVCVCVGGGGGNDFL